jgi:2-polyprenyl-3-methyl-5-hydroxy-6-metoxy-1,4-benzoquinol methylase
MRPENKAVCSHEGSIVFDRYATGKLNLCTTCGMLFSRPRDRARADSSVYRRFYKNQSASRFSPGVEFVIRLFRLCRAVALSNLSPDARTILDIGSGRGWMLYDLKKKFRFAKTAGIQISRPAALFSRQRLGLEIYDRDLLELDFGQNRFDIVTLWHVLEHVRHPQETVRRIHELLNPKGLLVVEVPNFSSWTCALTLPYWLGLDLDYHLSFFTPVSLISLLERNQFEIKKISTFSLEYSAFFSAQSILGRITRTDQLFYRWLQNPSFSITALLHMTGFCILFPPCLLINVILFFTLRGEVLRVVARKKPVHPAG